VLETVSSYLKRNTPKIFMFKMLAWLWSSYGLYISSPCFYTKIRIVSFDSSSDDATTVILLLCSGALIMNGGVSVALEC